MAIAGRQWHSPINGTRGSKTTITTLMTQGAKAPHSLTGDFRGLALGEETFDDRNTTFCDVFRVQNGKFAERWDVVE